jgi:phosphoglycerate dehydrogenase-like enzyme
VKVLFISQQGNEEPCFGDFVEALDGRFELVRLDHAGGLDNQFDGVRVVVDHGGWATRSMIAAGAAAGVELWQVIGTGLDHTEVDFILANGIRLANTPGQFTAIPLAEHALWLMLSFAKNVRAMEQNVRAGVMYRPTNDELAGSTLGLVGLGASGRALARRAAALEMRVVAIDTVRPSDEVLAETGVASFASPDGLHDLLRESDYVSLHIPLTAETRQLISREALAAMKASAVLINVARGGLVDEHALVDALREGRLRGAGIDTLTHEPIDAADPLLALDNVIATPHVAGVTWGTSQRRCEAAVENLVRVSQELPPLYEVHGPT